MSEIAVHPAEPTPLDLLSRRRSVPVSFLAEPGPDPDQLATLLTIASRVPDHGRLAPWRFIVFEGEGRRVLGDKLADLVASRDPETPPARLAEERARFARAPVVVGVVSRAAPHARIPVWEQELSAGAACFALEVAAHAMGFAANWLSEWVAYDAEAGRILGLAEGERVAGFIHIGTPTVPPQERPRPSLGDIVSHWNG